MCPVSESTFCSSSWSVQECLVNKHSCPRTLSRILQVILFNCFGNLARQSGWSVASDKFMCSVLYYQL